jgi:PAS domain S-box-containing protein
MKLGLRFPPPLHVLVLVFVLSCAAASVALKTLVLDRGTVERFIDQETETTQKQAQRLASIIITSGDKRALAMRMKNMRNAPFLRWAVVCDAQGIIIQSTTPSWKGKMLSEAAPPQAAELMSMVKDSREPAHLIDEGTTVTAAVAVPASPDAPLEYVTFAERDLSASIARREAAMRQDTLISSAMLLAYSFLLWFLLYVFLKWRVRNFYRSAGIAGRSPSRQGHGGDEFTEIADVLGEAEHLLHDIGANLQETVWILTPDLKPVYLSPSFETIHMRKREDVYGNNAMPDYILEEHRNAVREAFAAVTEGAPTLHLEYRIRRGDGQIRWVEIRGQAVRDVNGELQRIVGITRDVTEQKTLQEELVNASDQERHSLGHDLHDDACQRIAAMKLKCEALAHRLDESHSPQSGLALELTKELSETSALLRNMARGLAPVEVEGDGLVHALQKLIRMQESIHEVPIFFEAKGSVVVENEDVATHLYRIAQELITNAARHAQPTQIYVKLEELSGSIRLTVINDGMPMQKAAPGHMGMGLKIIHYRASAIGATIETRSRKDGITGTVVVCTVPQDACTESYPALEKAIEPALRRKRRERPVPQSH